MIEYNAKHWTSHLFDLRNSMFHAIFGRIMVFVGWSVVVLISHDLIAWHYGKDPITIPTTIHTLVGFALGTLLVFRTNTSYDRFWEGRKLWGGIVNESRNLTRQARVFFKDDPELIRSLTLWTMAWPHSAMHSLRGGIGFGPAGEELPANEIAEARSATHISSHVAERMTAKLLEARDKGLISDVILSHMDQNIQLMIDYLGGCERIKKTPLPFAYMVHIRRALMLYCTTLPFALVNDFGTGAIVGTFLVAYIFFGIEEIGVEIENPFDGDENDLPLEKICETIDNNLRALLPAIDDRSSLSSRSRPLASLEPITY